MDAGFLLLVELRKEEYQDDLILALTDAGAGQAVVLDGVSMQQMMAFDLPIFAGFREELTSQPGFAKVVICHAGSTDVVPRTLSALAASGADFQAENIGRMMLLPLAAYVDGSTRAGVDDDDGAGPTTERSL